MRDVLAMILAGGAGNRLSLLSEERAKPAVPFGGKYRVIDFTLSNCVNSSIYRVAVVAQYNPRSLSEHIGTGKPWDLDRHNGGVTILQPYLGRERHDWYQGTSDAVYHNLYVVERQAVDQVLILAGDHVYTMRYDHMVEFHRRKEADVTVGVVEVPWEEASRMGNIFLNEESRLVGFVEKPFPPQSPLASMGIYLFNKDFLVDCLERNAQKERSLDFGSDILPRLIETCRIFGYRFRGYWRDVGTIEAYWKANMDLITDLPPFNLYDPEMKVYTNSTEKPPVKLGPEARIQRSLVSNGCIINGEVWNSVLSPGVYVERGAMITNSIIFNETYIGTDSQIDHCIIDKEVKVEAGGRLGYGRDYTPNQDEPNNLNCGITIVGKGAHLPPGICLGRNVKVDCWTELEDFADLNPSVCPSGITLQRKTQRRFRV